MPRRTVFNVGYECPNRRIINRFTPVFNSHVKFGYPRHEVAALPHVFAAVQEVNAEVHNGFVFAEVEWSTGCPNYRNPDATCTCPETYMQGKSAAAGLEAECFAKGVLAAGDLMVLLSAPVPAVSVRSDRVEEYNRHRIGSYARHKKRKKRRNRVAFLKKKAAMQERYGIGPGPLYDTPDACAARDADLDSWMSDNKDGLYQLECWQKGIIQSLRLTDSRFIRREKVTSGHSYKRAADGSVFDDTVHPWTDRKGKVRSERMQPPLLKWCFKQFELGAREFCDFKFTAVMERGQAGGMYHYHSLMHIYRIHGGLSVVELEEKLRLLWFKITGNLHYSEEVIRRDSAGEPVLDAAGTPIVDTKSWFQVVSSSEEAASYVSKYQSKGWFSRRQTSKYLNLKDAARDARLIAHGFLKGDVAQNFVRHRDGFLSYKSPFEDEHGNPSEELLNAGCKEWVGLELTALAPENFPHFRRVDVVATFLSSSPCTHPAAAIAGSCFDVNGNRLDVIPQARWFPLDVVVKGLVGTGNADKLRSQLNRAHLRAIRAVQLQRDKSGMDDVGAAAALFDGRFPFLAQREEMQASLESLPDAATAAMSIPKAASDRYFASLHAESLQSRRLSDRYLRLRSERRADRAARDAVRLERYARRADARSP